jgi:hypothetical protein
MGKAQTVIQIYFLALPLIFGVLGDTLDHIAPRSGFMDHIISAFPFAAIGAALGAAGMSSVG